MNKLIYIVRFTNYTARNRAFADKRETRSLKIAMRWAKDFEGTLHSYDPANSTVETPIEVSK